jgi:hypothetical protein
MLCSTLRDPFAQELILEPIVGAGKKRKKGVLGRSILQKSAHTKTRQIPHANFINR